MAVSDTAVPSNAHVGAGDVHDTADWTGRKRLARHPAGGVAYFGESDALGAVLVGIGEQDEANAGGRRAGHRRGAFSPVKVLPARLVIATPSSARTAPRSIKLSSLLPGRSVRPDVLHQDGNDWFGWGVHVSSRHHGSQAQNECGDASATLSPVKARRAEAIAVSNLK